MKIAGLQRASLIDYPGYIAATVFLAGCNLDCGYCYNRWMIDATTVPEALSETELLAWLKTRIGKLQGVCISGGEPLVHSGLADLIQEVKQLGYRVKLDTNGTWPQRLQDLLSADLLDYVALDIKGPLSRYEHFSGFPQAEAVRQTMEYLRRSGVTYEFRTTVCPDMTESDLEEIASLLNPQEHWYLQPFKAVETVQEDWRTRPTLSMSVLAAWVEQIQARLPLVKLRGVD